MARPEWTECPECGASVKADKLDAHRASAHASAAAKTLGSMRRFVPWIAGVLVVGLIVAGLAYLGTRPAPKLDAGDDPYAGSVDAPLTIYLFEDYQCPHCRNFELAGGWDDLKTTWVDTGDVRVVFKDLAFLGDDSWTAAEASECVWEQDPDEWLDWKHAVFVAQGPERSGWASEENLIAITEEWGKTDMATFTDCLTSGRMRAEVEADVDEAREAGVNSTPTLVVGGSRLNANDRAAVDAAIREALGR